MALSSTNRRTVNHVTIESDCRKGIHGSFVLSYKIETVIERLRTSTKKVQSFAINTKCNKRQVEMKEQERQFNGIED